MQMDNKPLRVFVIEHRGTGGMIHYAYQLCSAMENHGSEVTLVTALEYELEQLPHNFKVVRLLDLWSRKNGTQTVSGEALKNKMGRKLARFVRRIFRGLKLIATWFTLVNYCVSEKPDIVQFGAMEFPFEAFFLQYMKRRGLVITQICHEFEHRETSSGLIHRLDLFLQTIIYKNFDAIFFHAQNNLDRFRTLYTNITENLFVIPHGNEDIFIANENIEEISSSLKEKFQLPTESGNILFFGSITPSKGLDDLIIAFSQVLSQRKDARLIIAGRPTKYVKMQYFIDLIYQNNLQEAVVLDTRYIPNEEIGALMRLSSVVVYPYHNSTQSGSLQVAYSFGKPIIATDVGGLPEVVEDGKSGLLVPPKQPTILAEAIMKIINDPIFAQELGNYAKELSETKFAWGPIAKKILDIYSNQL